MPGSPGADKAGPRASQRPPVPCQLRGQGLALGRRCHGAGHCLLHAPTPSPSSAMHRGGNTAGLQQGPRDPAGRMLVPGSLQPRAQSSPVSHLLPAGRWQRRRLRHRQGRQGPAAPRPRAAPRSLSGTSRPRTPVPCFFHRFCVSISTELMNNSNMNIIHSIWAGVISGREEIKSSKRLVGSSPARASRGAVRGRRAALGSHHPTPALPLARSRALR